MKELAMNIGFGFGVGVGDLQLAAQREVRRVMKQAKGDRDEAVKLTLGKLVDMQCLSREELQTLTNLFEIGFRAAKDKSSGEKSYLEARRVSDEMLASGKFGPVALALAAAETNSYVSVQGEGDEGTVIYKKSSNNWTSTLTAAGAVIGGVIGGADGAALGGVIGGVVGKAVDECIE